MKKNPKNLTWVDTLGSHLSDLAMSQCPIRRSLPSRAFASPIPSLANA